eukprot:CAMPEP_0115238622 /NCGR_PEP_ID=MMETSP0270-20121206/36977_1 /TAXON_ID=71861 /ORGANISM="Scrippsiella trochoidea, Strain CCMP3099" /LENGTH=135 /DNA_ID=CAMNT_0002653553 /DNA_START=147 /DNA_END=554 /DNA_ORIENTATION=-
MFKMQSKRREPNLGWRWGTRSLPAPAPKLISGGVGWVDTSALCKLRVALLVVALPAAVAEPAGAGAASARTWEAAHDELPHAVPACPRDTLHLSQALPDRWHGKAGAQAAMVQVIVEECVPTCLTNASAAPRRSN